MDLHTFEMLMKMTFCTHHSHFRNADYYEKISDPLDLATIEKQILTGYYKTVEAFDGDMLKVFRNAEVRLPLALRLLHTGRIYPSLNAFPDLQSEKIKRYCIEREPLIILL